MGIASTNSWLTDVVNRGVSVRRMGQHGVDFGPYVYMIIDEPGVYYSEKGDPLAESVAKAAGFDTDEFARARNKREALAKANAEIEARFSSPDIETVIVKKAGYELVHVGHGRHIIRDTTDSAILTPHPISRDEADFIFNAITSDGGTEA